MLRIFTRSNFSNSKACGTTPKFKQLLLETLTMNKNDVLDKLSKQGVYYHLYMLDCLNNSWHPDTLKPLVRHCLHTNTAQKINSKYWNMIARHFPQDSQLLNKYTQPHLRFPQQHIFTLNNKKLHVLPIEQSDSVNYSSWDKLLTEVTPTEGDIDKFKIKYTGEPLSRYLRNVFSQDHLTFDKGRFYIKYNNKRLLNAHINSVYRYVTQSTRFPVEVNFIDMPSVFQLQEVSMRMGVPDITYVAELANYINIFTKVRFSNAYQPKCSKCNPGANNSTPEVPDGYLSILTLDGRLYLQAKTDYMVNNIVETARENQNNQNYLVFIGEQYIDRVRERLLEIERTGQTGRLLSFEGAKQVMMDYAQTLKGDSVQVQLKKSAMLELLLETNAEIDEEAAEQMGKSLHKKYVQAQMEFEKFLSFGRLHPNGEEKLESLYSEKCEALEVLFGVDEEPEGTFSYNEEEVLQAMEKISKQTDKTALDNTDPIKPISSKIKPNKLNL